MAASRDLIAVERIFREPAVAQSSRYPDAERIAMPSHWNISSLHGDASSVEDWVRIKRSTLVLGVKKGLTAQPMRVTHLALGDEASPYAARANRTCRPALNASRARCG